MYMNETTIGVNLLAETFDSLDSRWLKSGTQVT